MYKYLIRPFFFLLQAEKAHYLAMNVLNILTAVPGVRHLIRAVCKPRPWKKPIRAFGLQFQHPVGLAAGFDKDGKYIRALSCLGFSFIEVGTVTPRAQVGNPRPRLFRLKDSEALINRMGFNNAGCAVLAERLKKLKLKDVVVGANIGKNKDTPNAHAVDDYVHCFETLFDLVNYFVVNVSSPNTPNLRDLQDREPLTALLSELQRRNQLKSAPKPILLKIAPDLTSTQLDDITEIVRATGIAGIVATNTTVSRELLSEHPGVIEAIGSGGVSGTPVRSRATEVVEYLHGKSNRRITMIGVGGINSAETAQEKLTAGATLVQLYTGFIYKGPGVIRRIVNGLEQS